MTGGLSMNIPSPIRIGGDRQVDRDEREIERNADRERVAQLADDERRDQDRQRHVRRRLVRRPVRDACEDVDVVPLRLAQHERAQRFARAFEESRAGSSPPRRTDASASRSIRSNVGVMITNVSTTAKPVSTGFGGSAAAPIAARTSESTTTMRTNDVESTSTNGAIESSVSPASTSSGNVA